MLKELAHAKALAEVAEPFLSSIVSDRSPEIVEAFKGALSIQVRDLLKEVIFDGELETEGQRYFVEHTTTDLVEFIERMAIRLNLSINMDVANEAAEEEE